MLYIKRFGWLLTNDHDFAKLGQTEEERRKACIKRNIGIKDSINKE